ncbi:MAG: Uma2 family endonuclease [Saprospiraceae bacterium]
MIEAKKYSVAEYLDIESRSIEKLEYYDGTITPPPSQLRGRTITHNRIARNVLGELGKALSSKPAFEIFGSDQKVYLPKFNFYLYPDAVVVAGQPLQVERQAEAIINPILIVEVLSKSTKNYDSGLKFIEYKSLPSFKEYVLLRQDTAEASTMLREAPDVWHSYEVEGLDKELWFRTIDERVPMGRIYDRVVF